MLGFCSNKKIELQYFYFENGQVSSKGYIKNGLPEGTWKSYYLTGQLKSIGSKRKGKSDSLWILLI